MQWEWKGKVTVSRSGMMDSGITLLKLWHGWRNLGKTSSIHSVILWGWKKPFSLWKNINPTQKIKSNIFSSFYFDSRGLLRLLHPNTLPWLVPFYIKASKCPRPPQRTYQSCTSCQLVSMVVVAFMILLWLLWLLESHVTWLLFLLSTGTVSISEVAPVFRLPKYAKSSPGFVLEPSADFTDTPGFVSLRTYIWFVFCE